MNRVTPLPIFHIGPAKTEHPDSGTPLESLIVESEVEGFSNGEIILDDVQDIFLLQDAIEAFIERHQLTRIQF